MILENSPFPEEVEGEVAALIKTLHEAERRLEELTGGEVDTVSTGSGQPFLLRRAQSQRRDTEVARQAAILNALPAHIALLDAKGEIVSVNETWREFASANFLGGQGYGVGANYLEVCDQATGVDSAGAREAADGIRSVLATTKSFSLEYPCHAPNGQRWFQMTVTPLPGDQMHGAVVMHVNITERKLAAAAFEEMSQKTARRERMLTTTLSSLTDFAYIYDRGGRFLFANQPLLDLWGLTLDEIVGKDFLELGYPPALARRLQMQVQEVFESKQNITGETPYTSPSGKEGFYEYIFSPAFGADGTVEFVAGSTRDITERKRTEQALRESNQKFQQLVDNITDAFWIRSPDFSELHYMSPAFERIWGRSVASLQANPKQWIDFVFPEDRERVLADFAALSDLAPSLEIEYRIVRPDGELRWVRVRGFQVRNTEDRRIRHIGIVTDITEREKAQESLRSSEKRFKAVFEQAAVGVAQAEAGTGRLVNVNQRFCEILGRSREELEQLTFAALNHPEEIAPSLEMLRKINAGTIREFTQEKRFLRKNGSEVWANVTISAMWTPGDVPDYFIAVVQDVTAQKRMEEQFRQSQKMDAIGTLAGGIAHDFNNILAAINGYTELSQMELTGNPNVRSHLGAVLQASGRATELVRQILTFSRQQKLERRPIELQPIVTEVFKLLRASIPSTIEFEISLKDAPVVLADATQIHQVLMNLGTNAWHAMKDRTGRLHVNLQRYVVDTSYESSQARLSPGEYARLSVSDSGSGMDQATLKRIFEPFFTTKPIGEGTGLGLAVVHGIMASHDGAVTVSSEPGEGTVFHLYFPAFAGAVEAAIDLGDAPRGNGERILFVDDEELLVRFGEKALTALGYEVEVSTQPIAALAMVRADPQRFALVLTDQTMPGMTGVDLTRQLLQLRPDLPIILLTGYGLSLTSERIQAAGIRRMLLKPTTIHSLASAVRAAIAAHSSPTHVRQTGATAAPPHSLA